MLDLISNPSEQEGALITSREAAKNIGKLAAEEILKQGVVENLAMFRNTLWSQIITVSQPYLLRIFV